MSTMNGRPVLVKGWTHLRSGDVFVDQGGGATVTIDVDERPGEPLVLPSVTDTGVRYTITGFEVGTGGPADGTYGRGASQYLYSLFVQRVADLAGIGFYTIQYIVYAS